MMLQFRHHEITSDLVSKSLLQCQVNKYLTNFDFLTDRDVPVAISLCSTNSIWCTTSLEENEKCEVIRAGGITTGVYPIIECKEPATSVVSCLGDVSAGRADFMGIDSNFGFLARQ